MKNSLIAAFLFLCLASQANAQTTLEVTWTDNTGGVNNGKATLRYNSGTQYGINHLPPNQGGWYGSSATPFGRYTPFPKPIPTGFAGGPVKYSVPRLSPVRLIKVHIQDKNVVFSHCQLPVFVSPHQVAQDPEYVTVKTFVIGPLGDSAIKNYTYRHIAGGLGIDVTFRFKGT